MGKRHQPEEIIGKLREAEIVLAQGGTTGDACRRIAVTEQTFGSSHAPGMAALPRVLIEGGRRHYNTVRPKSSLGYRPPAPEAGLAINTDHSVGASQ